MDTQKLNIKTHLENLSTILNDLLTIWYYMYIGTTFLQQWRSFQGECLFQINIGLFCFWFSWTILQITLYVLFVLNAFYYIWIRLVSFIHLRTINKMAIILRCSLLKCVGLIYNLVMYYASWNSVQKLWF